MADALCGPSNALQSFKSHVQADRSLQQDRLTGPRHSPAQGFRTPDPRAGSLDAEFAAFEAGPANPFQFEQPLAGHGAFPAFAGQPGPSNWANDFQRLQLNQPIPSQQFRAEAPLMRSSGGGWHTEFMRQRQGGGSPVVQEKQFIAQNQPFNHYVGPQMSNGMFMQGMGTYQEPMPEQMMHEPQHDMDYSQMEFENAFASAFEDAKMMNVDQEQGLSKEMYSDMLHQDGAYTNDHSAETLNHDRLDGATRIGSDAIKYTEKQDRTVEQDTRDADELARTAGQLLSAVQHDTSTKFQESQFMALMRKIRDREVEVRDEEFKSTTPGGTIQKETQSVFQTGQPESVLRPHDPNSFEFPDLNQVYEPPADPQHNEYTADFDHFGSNAAFQPQSQIQALHPGGRWYPHPHGAQPQMSGAISVEEFDRLDESATLSTRYQRPTVVDATPDGA